MFTTTLTADGQEILRNVDEWPENDFLDINDEKSLHTILYECFESLPNVEHAAFMKFYKAYYFFKKFHLRVRYLWLIGENLHKPEKPWQCDVNSKENEFMIDLTNDNNYENYNLEINEYAIVAIIVNRMLKHYDNDPHKVTLIKKFYKHFYRLQFYFSVDSCLWSIGSDKDNPVAPFQI